MPTPCCRCCQKKPTDLEVVHVYEVPDSPLLSRALRRGLLEVLQSDHSRTASKHFEEGRGAIQRHTEPERKEENKREIFPSQPKYPPPLADLISCPLAPATFSSFLSFRHCARRHSPLFILFHSHQLNIHVPSLCACAYVFSSRGSMRTARAKPPLKLLGVMFPVRSTRAEGLSISNSNSLLVCRGGGLGVRGGGGLCTCALLFT